MRVSLLLASRFVLGVAAVVALSACRGGTSSSGPTPEPGTTHATPATAPAAPTGADGAGAAPTGAGGAGAAPSGAGSSAPMVAAGSGETPSAADPASAPSATAPSASAPPASAPASKPAAATLEGANFIDDAKLLYRIAACAPSDEPLPSALTRDDPATTAKLAKIVEQHCKAILPKLAEFRATYFERGRAWFDRVVPPDVPRTVVYPFGGGDLLSALVAFPAATEVTTISLELAGDPRRLRTLSPVALERSLGALRIDIGGLISVGSNTSENLSNQQRNDLPGQVSSFLLGLVAGGYEPIAMRYFTLDDAGAIHYLDQREIDELDEEARKSRPKSLKHDWLPPSFSHAFANVEIQYRKQGGGADDELRVHRHIGWNLGDPYLGKHPQLLRHLERKGSVTMLTKGGSYLLYRGDFSLIRGYMLDHLTWMLSDSTGIPPTFAEPAGMLQVTYGHYNGAFLEGAQANRHDDSFIRLWKSQRVRSLPFRFGYVDKDKQAHVVVTYPEVPLIRRLRPVPR
jgi:hypothetical protein